MKRKFCLVFLFLSIYGLVAAQQMKQIQGKVGSENGNPLLGVTVAVKGSNISTATDAKGEFRLQVPDRNNITLVFSSVGFATQEVGLGSRNNLDVIMREEGSNLNDVVVIGYQSV